MTGYTAETLDLSRLQAPALVDIAFQPILDERLADFEALWEAERALDPTLPPFDVLMIEADPVRVVTRDFSFGDMILKGAINDTANALRLATAPGVELDHVAGTYTNTARLLIDAGDPIASPPRPPVYESDTEYRARAQLSGEALPLFGLTPGGYIWRVRRAFGDRVKGVRSLKRPGGRIDLVILARAGDGTPAETLIGDIQLGFAGEDASQSTDTVTVVPARIVGTTVKVVLGLPRGPAKEPVEAAAEAAIAALAAERHAIGETLHQQAIGAVAKVAPARYARVLSPLDDVVGGDDGAPFVTAITVTSEIDE